MVQSSELAEILLEYALRTDGNERDDDPEETDESVGWFCDVYEKDAIIYKLYNKKLEELKKKGGNSNKIKFGIIYIFKYQYCDIILYII